jgi:hypothetical protein
MITSHQCINETMALVTPEVLHSSFHQNPIGDLHQRDVDPRGKGAAPWEGKRGSS